MHAKSTNYKRKLSESMRTIENAMTKMSRPAIAFSGGKDSHVVKCIAQEIDPSVPIHFGHEQWILPETEALIASTDGIIKTALPDSHAEWLSVWQDKDEVPSDVRYIDPALGLNEFNYERSMFDWDGKFLGLRADENKHRRVLLHTRGELYFCQRHDMWECNPIAFWSTWDVWAYLIDNEIEYNKAYNKLATLGVPIERRRIGPLAQEKVLGFGQMTILKRGWPELFNRFAAKHPEARSYV